MSTNIASFRDYKPSRLRRELEQPAPQGQSIISDMADGNLATEFIFSRAGFDFNESQLVLTLIGILGDGEREIDLYDDDIAKVAECDARTVRRWRKAYLSKAEALNFLPIAVKEGEYSQEKERYLPTSYRVTFAETVEVITSTARNDPEYKTDRLNAIKRAADLHYEDIEAAPLRRRKRQPRPLPKTPLADINLATKKLAKAQTSLADMSERQRGAFVNGHSEELFTALEAMREQMAQLEAILANNYASVEGIEVDPIPDMDVRYPPSTESAAVEVRVKEEEARTTIEPEREHSPEDVAAFDSIIARVRQPQVKHTEIEIRAASDPPGELSYELDPVEAAERAAIQAEGCERTIETNPTRDLTPNLSMSDNSHTHGFEFSEGQTGQSGHLKEAENEQRSSDSETFGVDKKRRVAPTESVYVDVS